jgi:copper transport protein
VPRPARRVLVAGLIAASIGTSASGAEAHAVLRSSDPAAGQVLDAAPSAVTLSFTEPPEPSLSSVTVFDATGAEVDAGPLRLREGDAQTLELPLGDLAEGGYTVSWRVVSRIDGHATAGSSAFGVGVALGQGLPAPPTEPQETQTSPLEVGSRFPLLAGLVTLLGGSVIALVALRALPGAVRGLLGIGLALALLGLVGLAVAQSRSSEVSLADLLRTGVGRSLMWRAGGLVAAGAGLAMATGGGARLRLGLALVALGAVGTVVAHVSAGHAAGADDDLLQRAGQIVHVLAVSVWLGGLATLLVGTRGTPNPDKARAVRRFSAVALFAVLVVAGTGTIRAIAEVGSFGALFDSAYGLGVLAKVGVLIVLVALGAVNRYRNVPRAGSSLGALRRVGGVEVGLAAVAVGVASLITSLVPPAARVEAVPAPERPRPVTVEGTDFARSVGVRLTADPGDAGPNTFTLVVRDPSSGEPVDAQRVGLRFEPLDRTDVEASSLELDRAAPGRYTGSGGNLSLPGRWRIIVLIQETTDSREVELVLSTPCRTTPTVVAGQPTIHTADLPAGGTVQGYLDPGSAGPNEVHVTFFDPRGAELPVTDATTITSATGDEPAQSLEPRRLSDGHFVATADVGPGRWRFEVVAETEEGDRVTMCFEETIR